MTLTKQEQKVFDYILAHPGATTADIQRTIGVTCPSGRITEMRKKGVNIIGVGKKHYDGAHPFEMYAIGEPAFLAQETEAVRQLEIALATAPTPVAIEAAATEQENKQNNYQNRFHVSLQCPIALNAGNGRKVPFERQEAKQLALAMRE